MAGMDFGSKGDVAKASGESRLGNIWKRLGGTGGLIAFCLGCAVGVGAFALALGVTSTVSPGSLSRVQVTSSDLDVVVGRYMLKGAWHEVTAREVIETNASVESATGDDGMVRLPTTDEVVAFCRNAVVDAECASRGIAVEGEALDEYAKSMFGTSDIAEIAKAYQMDEERARAVIEASARSQKLRESVVGEQVATGPEAPSEPVVEGAGSMPADELSRVQAEENAKPRKTYADYIIKLVGDEWDATAGTWASADGPYAKALQSFDVKPDGASYDAAITAYYLAYQQSEADGASADAKWTDFVNDLLDKSSVEVYTLAM